MPAVGEGNGPSYISAHSADVILSDIRPIRLKNEALRAINALLDEFLSRILSTSCSLHTDKLRASLLSLLPTSLGKEALLEAEVELRAFWERTENKLSANVDDSRTFHQEWAFELLRQKCEAYSTLNEEDEDPTVEARINERFSKSHPHPPTSALLDPAALYLTAILESLCEHVLSNVGRVAARDSSRTTATVNDLFTALCEDDSIYGLFKMMKVYEQIELMSKAPKTRRSKSFTRNDRSSISRTSSPQSDPASVNPPSASKPRQSFDGQTITPVPSSGAASRTSFEKARAIRMFSNNKSSVDVELPPGHKKTESLKSDSLKSFPDDETLNPAEDAAMLREFDDLMRSASTMKVSLTPDRLRTMEVYKQEKDHRSTVRRPGTHFSSRSEPEVLSASRANSQRPSLRHVDSIVEDEEDQSSPKSRTRKGSITIPPVPSLTGVLPSRTRSVSTSNAVKAPPRKLIRTSSTKATPASFSQPDTPSDMVQSREVRYGRPPPENNGFPPRTRVRQRNRDSLDLDDVMNGSDDDQDIDVPVRQQPQPPQTPRRANGPSSRPAVSAKTRELMDFLAEGPPEPPQSHSSKNGKEFIDFLADGPPDYGSNQSIDPLKPKSTGRLQRMISKLNLGNTEKAKTVSDGPKTPHTKQPTTPIHSNVINNKPSLGSLANRPIPPRFPQPPPVLPLSPPSSPHDSSDENKSMRSLPRKHYQDNTLSRDPPSFDKPTSANVSPVMPAPQAPQTPNSKVQTDAYIRSTPPQVSNRVYGNGSVKTDRAPIDRAPIDRVPVERAPIDRTPVERAPKEVLTDAQPLVPARTTSMGSPMRKPVPSVTLASTPTPPSISEPDVRDMHRLMSNASTADECRLIVEMFMARNGIPKVSKNPAAPYPSPSPSVVKHAPYVGGEASLENSLVELFLGGAAAMDSTQQIPPTHNNNTIDGMPGPTDGSNINGHASSDVPIPQGPQAIPLRA